MGNGKGATANGRGLGPNPPRSQTSLVTAQAQELRARAGLNQAIAQLQPAVGGTLGRHGVTLDPSDGQRASGS